jgi:hypothetical protein
MLTQFQIIEPQAAILVACPRPRALATVPAAEWSHSAPIVAQVRRVGSAEAVRPSGYGIPGAVVSGSVVSGAEVSGSVVSGSGVAGYGVTRVLTDAVRVELRGGNGFAGTGMAGSKQRDPQKQNPQHLTARRGPVTWRPPH